MKVTMYCGACGSPDVQDKLANNWDDFHELKQPVSWRTATSGTKHILFEALVGQEKWAIRMNDFPDEPMYTLIVNDRAVFDFDDWPAFWGDRPAFPPPVQG